MLLSQSSVMAKLFAPPNSAIRDTKIHSCSVSISCTNPTFRPFSRIHCSKKSDSNERPTTKNRRPKPRISENEGDIIVKKQLPTATSRKPRRGPKSEAEAVEDYVRDSLGRAIESIRQRNPEAFAGKENILEERRRDKETDSDGSDSDSDSDTDDEDDDGDEDEGKGKKRMVVEEDNTDWPVDADVGWGVRASEYFDQHAIRNVVGEDGVEIDWEREMDEGWVKEINCLEWESFAFHPSPLVVLVFERYKRAADNWKALQELEKAAKVYWSAKDRLPPRTVKLDINIEKDLAYALNVKEGPQILFLRGNKMLYRETEIRTSDELVQIIAHFYYNAKKPSWI